MNKTFSDVGVSENFLLGRGEEASYTVVLSEGGSAFDGRLYLERSDNGGLSWDIEKTVTASGYIVNSGKTALYRFRCNYSSEQEIAEVPALTGTATIATTDVVETVKEFLNANGKTVAKITETGLDASVLTQAGVQAVTTTGTQTLTNKTLTAPVVSAQNMPGKSVAGTTVLNLGDNSTIGTHVKVIEEVVVLTDAAAKFVAMTTPIPSGAVILSVQANIETTVVAEGTTAKVGIGLSGGDVDAYGLSADNAKNTKVNTIPDWAVLSGATTIAVCGVVSNGSALGDSNFTAGTVRVRVAYMQLVSLADA